MQVAGILPCAGKRQVQTMEEKELRPSPSLWKHCET